MFTLTSLFHRPLTGSARQGVIFQIRILSTQFDVGMIAGITDLKPSTVNVDEATSSVV
jgi:hypothetical protein